jgi:hypothetical protein
VVSSLAKACLPVATALIACCAAVIFLVHLSRVKIRYRRIRALARDEQGGVQSLAFVMTFPLFLLLFLFIVQLSQLLIGTVIVHYAAFASARAASVWIPAMTTAGEGSDGSGNLQNELPIGITAGQSMRLSQLVTESVGNRKYSEIWTAAALACVTISPSRNVPSAQANSSTDAQSTAGSLLVVVQALDSSSAQNRRLGARLRNKVAYSFANTTVDLRFEDRSSIATSDGIATYNPLGHPTVAYDRSEVGWQDPIEVTVRHRFALLPGPGRWLAAGVANRDEQIIREDGVYKTTLSATVTMTADGLQSLRPTVHSQ